MFTACPAVTDATVEEWETSHLDGKRPSQVDYVNNRPVCFQVQSVCIYGLSGGVVLELN